jgi:glycosyltransferase involved in cell wall biosynthesis
MISVIIPSYNSESTISKCLDALKNQEYRGEYELSWLTVQGTGHLRS